MILILLGTIKYSFKRILNELEILKTSGLLNEEIVAQIGHTKFKSTAINTFDFKSKQEIDKLILKANIVISHSGTGSAISVLRLNTKLILAPRYSDLKEHSDNHQLDLAQKFKDLNYCSVYFKNDNLLDVINKTYSNNFLEYKSNSLKSIVFVDELIKDTLKIS